PPRGPGIAYAGGPIGGRVDIEFDIGPAYYNFIDVRFIGEPVLRDRIFPYSQNVTYISNTVNVINITVQNNIVYNYGPDYNTLSSYSSRPIQRLSIDRQPSADLSAAAKTGALTKVQGDKLMVGAPQKFSKGAAGAPPPKVKAKVAQPKIEKGWTGVSNEAQVKEKIKTENPKNIPPPTRAAARAAGSPSPAVSGGRSTGRKVVSGATAAPAGGSPSPFERAKPTPGGRPRPGATAMPPGPAGLAPSPFERGRGKPGGRPPFPGATASPAGAPGATAPPTFRPSPPSPEHGRPPARTLGESPSPGAGGAENIPPQRRGGG